VTLDDVSDAHHHFAVGAVEKRNGGALTCSVGVRGEVTCAECASTQDVSDDEVSV
jgi:hypothetical protein